MTRPEAPDFGPPTQRSPDRRPQRRHNGRLRMLVLAVAACVGGIFWAGSNRMPADATEPLSLSGPVAEDSLSGSTFRIGSFNIHGGKGTDGRYDLDRTADCLQGLDFAGLYEVYGDFGGLRTNQAESLAEKLGAAWLFAPTSRRWWHNHFGNALLTRVGLTAVHRIPLPGTQGKKFRNAVLTGFRYQGQTVRILLTHVDNRRDHDAQLRAVCDLFLSLEEPCVLMGDLNASNRDPELQRLLTTPGVTDALAMGQSAFPPERRIDWIITRGLHCVAAECRETIASDHPVCWAELALPPAARTPGRSRNSLATQPPVSARD